MVLGDLDSYMQKTETRPPTYTIHKYKFNIDKGLKYKSKHHKSPRGKHWQENLRHSTQQHPHRQINKQMLERMQRKGSPSTLLVGMQTGAAAVENNMESPQKMKNGTAF